MLVLSTKLVLEELTTLGNCNKGDSMQETALGQVRGGFENVVELGHCEILRMNENEGED